MVYFDDQGGTTGALGSFRCKRDSTYCTASASSNLSNNGSCNGGRPTLWRATATSWRKYGCTILGTTESNNSFFNCSVTFLRF